MKIAFLVDEFPSISETFILDQITWLVDHGCEVDVYAQRVHRDRVAQPDVAAYSLMARATQLQPPSVSSKWARVARGIRDVAASFPKDPSIVVRTLSPVRFGWDALKLKSFYRAEPFLARRPYDVVHCHFGPNGLVAAQLRNLGALRAPIVTQFHGYDASSYVRDHGSRVYRALFDSGDLFLCVSERIRQRLLDLECAVQKTRVHHTGVKSGSIAFAQRSSRADGTVRLLTVGRLVEKKGIEFGIRAVSLLLRDYPGVKYTIVGDGPERASLVDLCRRLGIEGSVHFVGAAARSLVMSAMSDSDVLLAPSVVGTNGDEEGIPVVLMEALASGLPVVSTRHAGIPELIEHQVSGLLAPERDADALAEQLKYLISHHEERDKMALAGRRVVEEKYDVEKLNAELLAIYEQLVRERRAS